MSYSYRTPSESLVFHSKAFVRDVIVKAKRVAWAYNLLEAPEVELNLNDLPALPAKVTN